MSIISAIKDVGAALITIFVIMRWLRNPEAELKSIGDTYTDAIQALLPDTKDENVKTETRDTTTELH